MHARRSSPQDRDGLVSVLDLAAVARGLGRDLSDGEVRAIAEDARVDAMDRISLAELARIVEEHIRPLPLTPASEISACLAMPVGLCAWMRGPTCIAMGPFLFIVYSGFALVWFAFMHNQGNGICCFCIVLYSQWRMSNTSQWLMSNTAS
jgi:hypothetical protein